MTWTADMRMTARFMYEKQDAELDEIATAVGKSAAGVRMMLVKAGVYKAKTGSAADLKLYKNALDSVGLALL
jgi:hypothetical protein